MGKKLLIVESPAKATTINRYLGDEFEVLATYGHIRDLPSKDGAVDVDDKLTYSEAPDQAVTLNAQNYGGFSDWRVPSLDELGTITIFVLDADVARGLDDSYFPHNYTTTSSDRGYTYWTSTPNAGDSAQAWSQTFESGGATQNRVDKTTLVPMRLVRGGQ